MLEQVKTWIVTNPSRDAAVAPIEIRVKSDTGDVSAEAVNAPGGCIATPLDPPGPVSFYLWHTDPLYRGGGLILRRQILRETLVQIAKLIETDCRGHHWRRNKILEQLAAQQTAAVSPPQDTHELDEALCFVLGYQKIIVDEIHKKILHFPTNFMEWSSEKPVWGTALGTRCVLHLPGEKHLSVGLGLWITALEEEGWKMRWPVPDEKLDKLKYDCQAAGLVPRVDKPKKEDYAVLLGRHNAVAHLLSEFPLQFSPNFEGSPAQRELYTSE
jgi:hypothetical protein